MSIMRSYVMRRRSNAKRSAGVGVTLLIAGLIVAGPTFGQETKTDDKTPHIEKVAKINGENEGGLGDEILVTVANFPKDKQAADTKWILFFNGTPLPGIYPDNVDYAAGKFRFYLRREGPDPGTREASVQA